MAGARVPRAGGCGVSRDRLNQPGGTAAQRTDAARRECQPPAVVSIIRQNAGRSLRIACGAGRPAFFDSDLKVQRVNAYPASCGKWQIVDYHPDFKVQFVDSYPDLKVAFVNSFPSAR